MLGYYVLVLFLFGGLLFFLFNNRAMDAQEKSESLLLSFLLTKYRSVIASDVNSMKASLVLGAWAGSASS